MSATPGEIVDRLRGGLVPAVPVPFRGSAIDEAAQRSYAEWMARQPVAGVAVWAHTGRGPHLSPEQRRTVLECWRDAMPGRVLVAGARDMTMAIEARRGRADVLLAFPRSDDPIAYHRQLAQELPVLAFYLYEAAGGVAYDDATLDAILALPKVIGIKVATLDSVTTYQRLATLVRRHPGKLLVTGEDRFLGYSVMLGADAALIGMGAALPAMQHELLASARAANWTRFVALSAACDAFAQATFTDPMEGYIRRMLWAAAADGALPDNSCDDPWGPSLDSAERARVVAAVASAHAARG